MIPRANHKATQTSFTSTSKLYGLPMCFGKANIEPQAGGRLIIDYAQRLGREALRRVANYWSVPEIPFNNSLR